jgi:cysteine desulfurase
MFSKRIYADYASTTPLSKKAKRAMRHAEKLGNPSAIYREGVEAKKMLEEARALCARAIESRPEEIIFTSGGTESNNLAIAGVIEERHEEGVAYEKIHIITTPIEHASVLECVRTYERRGVKISFADVNADGIVSVDSIAKLVRPDTALVSVMYANNEIGTIQPIHEIGEMLRKMRKDKGSAPLFHSDACQAPLYLSLNRETLRIDLMSLDAHKIGGPRGVGILFIKNGVKISPFLSGGGQEKSLRPTTENISGIAGMAAALGNAAKDRERFSARVKLLRDYFVIETEKHFPEALMNGSADRRLPNNANFSFPWIEDAEFAVLWLDARGIAVSTKSSCLAGEEESYVVRALGSVDPWRAKSALRFTFGAGNTRRDIVRIVKMLENLKKSVTIAKNT